METRKPIESVDQFIARLQDYFGERYTITQRDEVRFWADKLGIRTLDLVYRYCVFNLPKHYSPPGVKDLNDQLREIESAYPELQGDSWNRQIKHNGKLIDSGAFLDAEQLLSALALCLTERRNPEEDPTVQGIMKKNGY